MQLHFLPALFWGAPVCLAAALAQDPRAQSWAGEFRDERITLTLAVQDAAYVGVLAVQGKPFQVDARVEGAKLVGTYGADGQKFPFEATLEADVVTVVSGAAVFRLTRVPAAAPATNPLESLGALDTPAAAPHSDAAPLPPVADALAALRDLGPAQVDPTREWTILVYLAGDNDLEQFGLLDLDEMERALPEKGVEVLVLIDRAAGFDDSQGDWQDARLYRVRRDATPKELRSPILHNLGEVNTGDAALLGAFVEGGLRTFPARNHAVVMWDHGGGWSGMANDLEDGDGVADELTLPELRAGIQGGLQAAGVAKLDLMGFDMCLMAQLEVAAELEGLADVMVASQALEPGDGWPYDRVLPQFGRGILGGRGLGSAIVRVFDEFYDERGDVSTTLSCVDLRLVGDVLRTLDLLTARLEPDLERAWPVISRSLFLSESYAGRGDYRKGVHGVHSLDLLDMFKRLRHGLEAFPAEAEFRALVDVMDRYIIATGNNARRRLSTGTAIYAPVNSSGLSPRYAETRFATATGWMRFLAAVHALQDADQSVPKLTNLRIEDASGNVVQQVAPIRGHQFKASIEGRNIIWTRIYDGERDPDGNLVTFTKTILADEGWWQKHQEQVDAAVHTADLEMLQYKDGVTEVSTEYEGLRLVYTNGKETSTGTLDVTDLERGELFNGPALVQHKDLGPEPVEALLFLDRTWLEIVEFVLFVPSPGGGTVARRMPARELPEDLLVTPLHEVVSPNGEASFRASKPLRWEQGIRTGLELVKPGRYHSALHVEKMNGTVTRHDIEFEVIAHENLDVLIANWQVYKPSLLPGTWQLYLYGVDDKEVPTTVSFQFEALPQPDYFKVTARDSTKPAEADTQIWRLDRSGLPNFCIVNVVDGRADGGVVCPAFLAERAGEIVVITHMVALDGSVWVLHKTGAASPTNPDGTTSLGGPDAVPMVDANGLIPADDPARFIPVETPTPRPIRR